MPSGILKHIDKSNILTFSQNIHLYSLHMVKEKRIVWAILGYADYISLRNIIFIHKFYKIVKSHTTWKIFNIYSFHNLII